MAVLEPNLIPGLDRALLELVLIFGAVVGLALVITVASIAGVIRAFGRRRRGKQSGPAVVLALIAFAMTALWMGYWFAVDIHNRANPINPLLAINAGFCALPLIWLVTAIRANRAQLQERILQRRSL